MASRFSIRPQREDSSEPKIFWDAASLPDWEDMFEAVPRSNLLQSWSYARMMRARQHMSTRFGEFVQDGETIALFQVHEVKVGALYHVVTLDRGPLWLKEDVSKQDWQAFCEAYAMEFPKRVGRRRRFMPELISSPWAESMLIDLGFAPKALGYQSIWVDLTLTQAELRSRLKQKWRNALNQAERRHVQVHRRTETASFNWLMKQYADDRKQKRYRGPAVGLLKSLYRVCAPRDEVDMFFATKDDETIAGILIFRHGASATYQVGWTNEMGRKLNAHQLLLWHGMLALKADDLKNFDLGGIHPDEAPGVTQFKRGLGGEEFQLVGIYS